MRKYHEQNKNRISPDIAPLRIHWLECSFVYSRGLDYNEAFSQGFIETFKWMNHYESSLRNFLLKEKTLDPGGHV